MLRQGTRWNLQRKDLDFHLFPKKKKVFIKSYIKGFLLLSQPFTQVSVRFVLSCSWLDSPRTLGNIFTTTFKVTLCGQNCTKGRIAAPLQMTVLFLNKSHWCSPLKNGWALRALPLGDTCYSCFRKRSFCAKWPQRAWSEVQLAIMSLPSGGQRRWTT